jgi:hypothetical protein
MMFPLVRELDADRKIPVAVTCRVLGFSNQAFFVWRRNPVSQRDWDNAHLINAGEIWSLAWNHQTAIHRRPNVCGASEISGTTHK